jgi:UDP-glucose 4-epimerase/UDP-glucuronate decarboxylase
MSGRRILITGGAGFIGYHLACRLAEDRRDSLTILDNFSRGQRDEDLEALEHLPNVRIVMAELADAAAWRKLERGFDEAYHLAGLVGVRHVLERPHDVIRVNAFSTLYMLEWLAKGGAEKVLFSSTSEAYAWTQLFHDLPIPTPEDCPLSLIDIADPRSSYAGSKIFGELAVTHCCRASGKRFVVVRYHNVYGPRMGHDHVIPELFERALAGQDPLVVYSPEHRRAFCYVSDAVEATILAMRTPAADAATINIGNDQEEITIGELAVRIVEHAGLRRRIAPKPAVNDPIVRRCPDLNRARGLLGYEPRVALDAGLDETLAWYVKRPAAERAAERLHA